MKIDTTRLEKVMAKLKRKDPALFRAVQRKINQVSLLDRAAIDHFKNLRGEVSAYKRVHVSSFVLIFKIEGSVIIFDRFRHHDEAY